MPAPPLPDLASLSLAEIARLAEENRLPPVESWNPEHCGDSEMRIARDGTWYHQGSPIGRAPMVRLFSTILRREPDGRFVLVTPAEKLDIDRRRRALHCGRDEDRGRRRIDEARLPAQHRRSASLRDPSIRCDSRSARTAPAPISMSAAGSRH
jgi:hypothetical protein